jgi:hypothetical protein
MSLVRGRVAEAFSLSDRTLVRDMNLATALKERTQIESETSACSLRSLGFCKSAEFYKYVYFKQTTTIKLSICVFRSRDNVPFTACCACDFFGRRRATDHRHWIPNEHT